MRHSRKLLALALAIATPLAGQTFAQERQRIEAQVRREIEELYHGRNLD